MPDIENKSLAIKLPMLNKAAGGGLPKLPTIGKPKIVPSTTKSTPQTAPAAAPAVQQPAPEPPAPESPSASEPIHSDVFSIDFDEEEASESAGHEDEEIPMDFPSDTGMEAVTRSPSSVVPILTGAPKPPAIGHGAPAPIPGGIPGAIPKPAGLPPIGGIRPPGLSAPPSSLPKPPGLSAPPGLPRPGVAPASGVSAIPHVPGSGVPNPGNSSIPGLGAPKPGNSSIPGLGAPKPGNSSIPGLGASAPENSSNSGMAQPEGLTESVVNDAAPSIDMAPAPSFAQLSQIGSMASKLPGTPAPGLAQPQGPQPPAPGLAQPAQAGSMASSLPGLVQPQGPQPPTPGLAQPAQAGSMASSLPGLAQPAQAGSMASSLPGLAQPAQAGSMASSLPGLAQPQGPQPPAPAEPDPLQPSTSESAQPASNSSFDFGDDPSSSSLGGDDELLWEDEEPGDAGEKTQMLETPLDFEEEEEEPDGEKTQITMAAMDYDPLSGKLIVESGKAPQREYILVREKTTIGRAPQNDIAISDGQMSRQHADIDKFREGFRLRDLDSGNGTMLNGYRIRVAQLRNGDIIEIGTVRFRFEQTGGDPDDLWKGEPKIEYHPNQPKGAGQHAPKMNSNSPPPANSPAQKPQMESMLERQGGGIAAPAWAPAPPMTSPYMMSYGSNSLKNPNTAPMWANIVFIVLGVLCVGSVIWLILSLVNSSNEATKFKNKEAAIERIQKEITSGASAYGDQRFSDAMTSINNAATEIEKEEIEMDDKNFFEAYRKLINQEEDINKEIKKIRTKTYNAPSIEEIESDISFLQNVPDGSINKEFSKTTLTKVTETYVRRLRKEINDLVSSNKTDDARKLLIKMSEQPGAEKEVERLGTLISNKEKSLKR